MLRTEYPRPQFERKDWVHLNGTWDFEFDDNNKSLEEHWERAAKTVIPKNTGSLLL